MESAELILSAKGRIYHLDLLPEEISSTIILVGDPGRVAQVSKRFDQILFRRDHREFTTHSGILGTKRITVLSTGIGTDNIDIVLNELDALVNIDLQTGRVKDKLTTLTFIRIGTSGSLHPSIPVDSFLINTHSLGLDNMLSYYDDPGNNHLRELENFLKEKYPALNTLKEHPTLTQADESLIKHFSKGMNQGINLTAPGFYGPQGRQLRLRSRVSDLLTTIAKTEGAGPQITNFEMETNGIYGLSTLLKHKAVSCNVILANRPLNRFSTNANERIENLIEHVLAGVEDMDFIK
jgi:uridine phosphorylase